MPEESWTVLKSETVLHAPPFLTVTMQQVGLLDGKTIEGWSIVDARDYANAFVLNDAGRPLCSSGTSTVSAEPAGRCPAAT